MVELARSFLSYSAQRSRFTIRLKDCFVQSLARIVKIVGRLQRNLRLPMGILGFCFSGVYIWCIDHDYSNGYFENHVRSITTLFPDTLQSRSEILQWNGLVIHISSMTSNVFLFLKGLTDAEFVCLSKNMSGLLREARYEEISLLY